MISAAFGGAEAMRRVQWLLSGVPQNKTVLTAVLFCLGALGIAPTAFCLTVVAAFDSSITNDPNGPAMIAGIDAAIKVLQTDISDNFAVYIKFDNDSAIELGENNTWINSYSYQQYRAALKAGATDANDAYALSKLPTGSVDPVVGGANVILTVPLARHLGMDSGVGPNGVDSTIRLNMSLMNFTRPPTNGNRYDLQQVTLHEMDEVLGTSSSLPGSATIAAMDLFRYTTNLQRSYTTSGDNAYFSIDGTNLLARFNQASSGDYGDWWSATGHWAPPGRTPVPQVQDAFAGPGIFVDPGANELTMLDVVGWTVAVGAPPKAPTLWIAGSGAGHVTVYWPADFGGYVLQESTNLVVGVWTSSLGSANPRTIAISDGQKFYRLSAPAPESLPLMPTPAVPQPDRTNTLRLATHVLHRRKP